MRAVIVCVLLLSCTSDPKPEPASVHARDAGRREAGEAGLDGADGADGVEGGESVQGAHSADASARDAQPRDAGPKEDPADAAESMAVDAMLADPEDARSKPAPQGGASDEIFGQTVPRAASWWVADGRVYHGTDEVRLFGINWFGLESDSHALFGPSQANRTVADFLDQVASLGFNALRVPLAPESIREGTPSASWANHGSVDTGREQLEELAAAARDAGIYMLWDVHTCASSVGYRAESPLDPACSGYGKQAWLDDLRTLATLAARYAPYVLGIDLFNEPYGLSWQAWKALAEEGGEAVLRANPQLLVFVEGVGSVGYTGDAVFWGENLTAAAQEPPRLPASRLVYSPHVYGPSVYAQPYFAEASFPANMPAIWTAHWGSLLSAATPVVLGEFGGRYVDADRRWQDALAAYLVEKGARSFFYWCLNPNSGDTGGLLLDDWRSVDAGKLSMLKTLMR